MKHLRSFHRIARRREPPLAAAARLTSAASSDDVAKAAGIVTLRNVCASRWSAGRYGVLYAAFEIATAVTEHGFHLAKAARDTTLGREVFGRLHLSFDVRAALADARHDARYSDPNDYSAAQDRGAEFVAAGEPGVVYSSARRPGGTCAGVFVPTVVRNPVVVARVGYSWDGLRLEAFDQPISPLVF